MNPRRIPEDHNKLGAKLGGIPNMKTRRLAYGHE